MALGQLALHGCDRSLAAAFERPTKLTKGRDQSASGLEFSFVIYLAEHGVDDATIETALRHYPHGQIGSGKLHGENDVATVETLGYLGELRAIQGKYEEAEGLFQTIVSEIQEAVRSEEVGDYREARYSNHKSLSIGNAALIET